MSVKLNPKQQAFADYYIEHGNAYQAAVRAGYSKNYAKGNVSKLLENERVKTYIQERLEEIKSERVADQQEVMEFLTSVMRGEVDEPITVLAGEGFQRVEYVQPSAQTRRAAAVDIGKRYGMWTEKQQIDLNVPQFVEDVPADDD
ncbi:terminase small subunit [Bhargavaea ginsengi]|uniref:terminase small subunit n=1 Tax=Bhargavaea ginsengi TaxID=426757 RepID=UPI003C7933DE